MKKVILIQNDYSGAGKTTLSRFITRYLNHNRTHFQAIMLSEDESDADGSHVWIDPTSLTLREFVSHLDMAPITILETASGMGEVFCKFYQANELQDLLHELGVQMTVVVPVTAEPDSHEAVILAAETFSDNVQYLIAHTITSAYEDDEQVWDRSYAARIMDMFDAVELHIPEVGIAIEQSLRAKHTDLGSALLEADPVAIFGKDFDKWYRRVDGQIESARTYLFGDDFKPVAPPPAPKKRGRKPAFV